MLKHPYFPWLKMAMDIPRMLTRNTVEYFSRFNIGGRSPYLVLPICCTQGEIISTHLLIRCILTACEYTPPCLDIPIRIENNSSPATPTT